MQFLRIFFGGNPIQSRVYFCVSRVFKYILRILEQETLIMDYLTRGFLNDTFRKYTMLGLLRLHTFNYKNNVSRTSKANKRG